MNRLIVLSVAVVLVMFLNSCDKLNLSGKKEMKNGVDSISYVFGVNIGTSFRENKIDINYDMVEKGMIDAQDTTKIALTKEQIQQTMMKFQSSMMKKEQDKRNEESGKNKEAGMKFLEENKKKPGVKVLPNGLQYEVIKEGKGSMPKETDIVKVNYEGTLIDGKVFDSSYERNEPATFPLNQVIRGWTEALQLMPVGSTWKLYIPSDLAYGDEGSGRIPAGSTLIFKIELLEIEKNK